MMYDDSITKTEIEHFLFEADFIEDNVRCIPMIVRFKMDAAGIKLKLAEWSRFNVEERENLALIPCKKKEDVLAYHEYLAGLVMKYTGQPATEMVIELLPEWANSFIVPTMLQARTNEIGAVMKINQWAGLTHLQRFALLKLCRPGHESKNFKKAMKEFKIIE